jgi:hypothetical protein
MSRAGEQQGEGKKAIPAAIATKDQRLISLQNGRDTRRLMDVVFGLGAQVRDSRGRSFTCPFLRERMAAPSSLVAESAEFGSVSVNASG